MAVDPWVRYSTRGRKRDTSMKFNKLILKNILRNKRRTLLTLSSLVVSLFLIITLATILTELTRDDNSNPLRLITRHSVSLVFPLPLSQEQRIAAVPGVKRVMRSSWFGGIWKDEKNFFANFAVDADRIHEIMPELKMSDAEWEA